MFADFMTLMLVYFAGTLSTQLIAFGFRIKSKRVDVVDIAWGVSFIAGYLAMQLFRPTNSATIILSGVMITAWGLRLSWHIFRRFLRSDKQDERYTKLMSSWPPSNKITQSLFRIFIPQAIIASIVALPVIVVYLYKPSYGGIVIAGLVVWLIGYATEAAADRQLRNFIIHSKPNELMQSGLWRYSRHPNYFGEVTMWWGLAIMACSTGLWWLGIIGALTITMLICLVSGIPLAEARSTSKKGWDDYKRTTSVLIPWPPKK